MFIAFALPMSSKRATRSLTPIAYTPPYAILIITINPTKEYEKLTYADEVCKRRLRLLAIYRHQGVQECALVPKNSVSSFLAEVSVVRHNHLSHKAISTDTP